VEVESVIADSPGHGALLIRSRSLVGLTFNTVVHDMISANGAVVDDDIPGPESHSVPLLNFELLLALRVAFSQTCLGFAGGFGFGRAG